ncbi:hypothetical protein C2W64_00852 [Brevibacillus laterosporus]|nr:WIAG-tail domain [Brevibacillus laterosporus]RAP27703.1 hypothetical protein C2W64_00852 [Brevibacillus laterosporus]
MTKQTPKKLKNLKNVKNLKRKNRALLELDALDTALRKKWIDDSSDIYYQEETSTALSEDEMETMLQESLKMSSSASSRPKRKQRRGRKEKRKKKEKKKEERKASPFSKHNSSYPPLRLVTSTNTSQNQYQFIKKYTEEKKNESDGSIYYRVPSFYEESTSKLALLKENNQFFSHPDQGTQYVCAMPETLVWSDHDLQPFSVHTRHLQDYLITQKKIGDKQITSNKLADGSVTEDKLATRSVQSNHFQVSLVHAPHQLERIKLQQSGKENFTLQQGRVRTTMTIELSEPFLQADYVFVATTSVPFCFAVVQNKETNRITVEIARQIANQDVSGQVDWIAVGEKVQNQGVLEI